MGLGRAARPGAAQGPHWDGGDDGMKRPGNGAPAGGPEAPDGRLSFWWFGGREEDKWEAPHIKLCGNLFSAI